MKAQAPSVTRFTLHGERAEGRLRAIVNFRKARMKDAYRAGDRGIGAMSGSAARPPVFCKLEMTYV